MNRRMWRADLGAGNASLDSLRFCMALTIDEETNQSFPKVRAKPDAIAKSDPHLGRDDAQNVADRYSRWEQHCDGFRVVKPAADASPGLRSSVKESKTQISKLE